MVRDSVPMWDTTQIGKAIDRLDADRDGQDVFDPSEIPSQVGCHLHSPLVFRDSCSVGIELGAEVTEEPFSLKESAGLDLVMLFDGPCGELRLPLSQCLDIRQIPRELLERMAVPVDGTSDLYRWRLSAAASYLECMARFDILFDLDPERVPLIGAFSGKAERDAEAFLMDIGVAWGYQNEGSTRIYAYRSDLAAPVSYGQVRPYLGFEKGYKQSYRRGGGLA